MDEIMKKLDEVLDWVVVIPLVLDVRADATDIVQLANCYQEGLVNLKRARWKFSVCQEIIRKYEAQPEPTQEKEGPEGEASADEAQRADGAWLAALNSNVKAERGDE